MAKQQNTHTKLLCDVIAEAINQSSYNLTLTGIQELLGTDPYASVMAKVPGQYRDGKAAGRQKRDLKSVAEVVASNDGFSAEIKGLIAQAARKELNRNRTGKNPDEKGTDAQRATKALGRAAGRGALTTGDNIQSRRERGAALVRTVKAATARPPR